MAFDVQQMNSLLVAAILFFFLLIALAYLAPRAYEEIQNGGTNETSLGDVPGGGLITGVVILLGMMAIGFSAVIGILKLME